MSLSVEDDEMSINLKMVCCCYFDAYTYIFEQEKVKKKIEFLKAEALNLLTRLITEELRKKKKQKKKRSIKNM